MPPKSIGFDDLTDSLVGWILGLVVNPGISKFDDTDALAVVAGTTTVTLRTYTGKGTDFLVIKGDGDVDVEIRYSIDGAADVVVGTSDTKAEVAIGFATSLVIKAKNNNAAGKNRSGVSNTGVFQP